jgi:hypothetical protein
MPSRLSTFGITALLILLLTCTGCWKDLIDPFGIFTGGGDDRPDVLPDRVLDPTDKFSLAVGGVAPGRDELIIFGTDGEPEDFTGKTLACEAEDEIVNLENRPGFSSQAAGSGVRIVPIEPGVTAIRCSVDGEEMAEVYEVTVPPQSLIQILVAEALQQLGDEAALDEEAEGSVVKLDSQSPTGNALGSVIRNRISQINMADDPGLFMADEDDYDEDPQASYYNAVIMAEGQFSPTDSDDPNYDLFWDAQDRNFLAEDELVAYDQAVLTAAGIFNGDIADNTTGAFAFRSPTEGEWNRLVQAWTMAYVEIPSGAGWTDESFPAFAPIQILLHPDVWTYEDGRASFVFARQRTEDDFAVVRTP